MASTFKLEILTPEKKFLEKDVEMIVLRTPEGEMGILPGHTPMVIAIDIGVIKLKIDNEWSEAVLTEGFCEIQPTGTIIYTDTAEWPHEIDENRAKAAKQRAEERLVRQLSYAEYIRSRASLARAMARLKVTKKSQ